MPSLLDRRRDPSQEFDRFTGRQTEIQLLLNRLSAINTPSVQVFYGIGGAGKSWLLKKFRREVPTEVPMAILDFDKERGGQRFLFDPVAALIEIRQQLGQTTTRFDIALAMLRYKQGATEEPNAWIDLAAELVGSAVPGAGTALKALSRPLRRRLRGTAIEQFLARGSAQQMVLALRRMTSQEIGDSLIAWLAEDLAESLPVHLDRAARMVLLLDTYEAVGYGMPNVDHRRQQDKWIRDLVVAFDFSLSVIAGQNRLDWDEADPSWTDLLEQHELHGLKRDDAREFLRKSDIEKPSLQNSILTITADSDGRHHCLSLGLCSDIVSKAQSKGAEATAQMLYASRGDWGSLAHRLLRSLGSDAERLWIERLALTPRFDEGAAREAFSENAGAAQDAAWFSLEGYSFVELVPSSNAWFTIRSRLRQIVESLPNSAKIRTDHDWWARYWGKRSLSLTDEYSGFSWYHSFCLQPTAYLGRWKDLAESSRNSLPPRMSEHARLLTWWDYLDLLDRRLESREAASALNSLGTELLYASFGNRVANVRHAIECFERASEISAEGVSPREWVESQVNLGFAWWSLPTEDRASNLHRAIGCYEIAFVDHSAEEFPELWALAKNNLGNAWSDLPDGDRANNKRKGIEHYEAALRVRTRETYPRQWAMTQNNLGATWNELLDGNINDNQLRATHHYREALKVYRRIAYPQEWAMTKSNLGFAWGTLAKNGEARYLKRAIACCKEALTIYTEDEFPQDWARVQFNLGRILSEAAGASTRRLMRAVKHFEAALNVFLESEFPGQWAETQMNLGKTLLRQQGIRRREAVARALGCFEAVLRVYTEPNYITERAETLAHILHCREEPQNL